MARKLSTRKRPDRDVHMIKEQLKIEEGIFDNRTVMSLWKMFNHNIVSSLDYMIKAGKEADVYLAEGGTQVNGDLVALKIFRYETSDFNKRIKYIIGDPRFERTKKDIFSIVNVWCQKEFGNLQVAELAEIHAPRPYYFKGNVLGMEFIGSAQGTPAKTLKHSTLENPKEVLDIILEDMKKLYTLELVHADMSEYNILMNDGIPYLIDFGQAVVLKHPNAEEFLQRDVVNVLYYFEKHYKIERELEKTLQYIKK